MAKAEEEVKRGRGRPRIGAEDSDAGTVRKNLSMDEVSIATAARIHSNASVAVRMALAFWAEHNPPPKRGRK